ncbi:hypothetical protein HDU97_004615 [Phlyctochytrium planicorne]|nr:hypothetical protein HDU97_004615 [Phlyctochytrium planicorne]
MAVRLVFGRRRFISAYLLATTLLALYGIIYLSHVSLKPYQQSPIVVKAKNGAVSSENVLCSDAGVDILREGGSAVDAAIATSLCIGVTNMYSSGIGGGGFMLVRSTNGTYEYIDFRETAPQKAFKDMYNDDPQKAQIGGLSVGVPGEIRGFEVAHKRHGKLPWKRLFQSAIKISRDGWTVTPMLAKRMQSSKDQILNDEAFREVFAPKGTLLQVGQTIKRTTLATTLETIADEGAQVFYEGKIAELLVETTQRSGGILTLEDMKGYVAEIRKPLVGYYHGQKVVTTPSPASGAVLLSILNIIEGYNFRATGKTPVNLHRLVEAMKFAYAQRSFYGDPIDPIYKNITRIETDFISKDLSERIRANISDEKTFEPNHYNPSFDTKEDHGTMHVSVLTSEGDAVSLTSTVNLIFGARVMDKTTGIILNDEMDDFSIPGVPNAFGLPPSPYNFIHPKKRPLSSSVPVMTERNGDIECVSGASGGSRIITSTLQVVLNMLDFQMDVGQAVGEPRLHHQLFPHELEIENAVPQSLEAYFRSRGHALKRLAPDLTYTGVESIRKRPDGLIEAASDARKGGVSSGW